MKTDKINKRKYHLLLLLIPVGILVQPSCKKFVVIPPPVTELASKSVFDNPDAATAALTGIYTQMQSNNESFFMAQSCGLLSDELTNYSSSYLPNIQYYTNAMLALKSPGPWTRAYKYIY